MEAKRCTCGETLVTQDEIARAICWSCAGLSWRLLLMDSELAVLQADQEAARARPLLMQAS